jgi:hypothetical protein
MDQAMLMEVFQRHSQGARRILRRSDVATQRHVIRQFLASSASIKRFPK